MKGTINDISDKYKYTYYDDYRMDNGPWYARIFLRKFVRKRREIKGILK
jgi:hypothetical protein